MRTGADEIRAPKYAHIERERRWLVDRDARPSLASLPSTLIEDRYIIGTRLRLRRMSASESDAVSLKLTKKYEADDPLARPIVTSYLSPEEYDVFAALPAMTLTKRRFKLADAGLEFSVDQFSGALAGLELAEIECADDAVLRALRTPDWAVREVSHDPRYQGGSLAQFGIPEGQ